MAKVIILQLKEKGEVIRGMIGVQAESVTPEIAQKFGLSKPRGALVIKTDPGFPAAKAGIRSGDIIVDYNGKRVHTAFECWT